MTTSDAQTRAGQARVTSVTVPTPRRTTAHPTPRPSGAVLHPDVVDRVTASLTAGRSVLVVGEAGTGKTQSVTRAIERLRAAGDDVEVVSLSGTGTHDALPLAAFEPLLDDAGAAFGDFAGTLRSLVAGLDRRRGGGRLVLRIEDAHQLDEASARALDWLVRQDAVQVVATLRLRWAARAPWAALWKDDVVERLDLAALTRTDAERWLTDELGGPVTAETVHRLWRASSGSVMQLRETVQDALATHALTRSNGAWVWRGGAQSRSRMRDLAELDLQGASPQARAALEVCAVVCPVALDVLLDLVPASAVDELVLTGAITTTNAPTATGGQAPVVDLTTGAHADVARAGVPASRQRDLLQRALEAPVVRGVAPGSLVRSVALALDLGMAVPVARLDEAFEAAFAIHEYDSVVRLTTGALATCPPQRRAALHALRGDARIMLGALAEAERDLFVASQLLATAPLDAAAVGLLLHVADMTAHVAHLRLGDVDRALARLDEVVRPLREADPEGRLLRWRDEVEVTRLTRLGYAGRFAESLDAALAAVDGDAHPARRVSLAPPTALGLGERGRLMQALELCTRFSAVAVAHGDEHRWGRGEVLVATFFTLLSAGELDAVRAALAASSDMGFAVEWSSVHSALGLMAIAEGSWSEARTQLATARARMDVSDLSGMARYTLAAEAVAHAAGGDTTAARDLLDQAARAATGSTGAMEGDLQVRRLDALGWMHSPDLVGEARALARWARERGAARVELEALHRWVDATRRAGAVPDPGLVARVVDLGELCDGARSAALVAHVVAVAAQDADHVRIAERELNRRGLWLPPLGTAVSLTSREQEIASLAAGGMTSRAIAQRLVLSTRTVDSHLSRVFAKLGVHSREELGNVLR